MRRAAISAGDICTSLGNLQQTWKGLLACKSGIKPHPFSSLDHAVPLAVIEGLSGSFGTHERQIAMFDTLFASLPSLPKDCRLYCATTKAAVDELTDGLGDQGQPWQMTDYISSRLGHHSSSTMISAACVSSLIAIIRAAMDIETGKCDHALIVGFDLLSDFVVTGFSSLKALSATGARPFDRQRDGLTLGDGGGWMLLSVQEERRNADFQAVIDAWAITCDATHITAPSREGVGLYSAFRQIINKAGVTVGGVNGHGTATPFNDAMELVVFEKTMKKDTPICSVKGSLGHSLGAAGIIEVMLSVLSLQHGILPPTVGLSEPEETSCALSGNSPLQLTAPTIISSNSGFGGINAGVLLRTP